MRVRIHRGTKEIGGTCIEVEARGKRIVFDVGLPLDAPDDGHEDLLPPVDGFRTADGSLLGVIISHPHQDHYGLARHIRPEVPVYIGRDAHAILTAASAYVPNGHAFQNPRFLSHRSPLELGPFRVTPHLVDHSAFDAYGLLIEADGRRVYYSGDFRAHGRKSGLFEAMIKHPPQNIDVLLMEGTTIGRTGTGKGFSSEADLEEAFVQAFSETEGIHFVWASAQNIDRIVTIFRAAKRTNRLFVIDLIHGRGPRSHGKRKHSSVLLDGSSALYARKPAASYRAERVVRGSSTAQQESSIPGGVGGLEGTRRDAVSAHDESRPRCSLDARGISADLFDVAGLPERRFYPKSQGMA